MNNQQQEDILTTIEKKNKNENIFKDSFKKIIRWTYRNIKYLFIPGVKLEDLTARELEYKKKISKRKFIKRLKSVLTILGIFIIFMIVTLAIFAPWISPYSQATLMDFLYDPYAPPSPAHPFGTTQNGRDVLGRCIFGARTSLTIALPSLLLSISIGLVIGVFAGYYGGWVESVLMRLMDVLLAFPGLILVLVFISIWGPRIEYFMLAYGILGIAGYSRLIRGSVMQAKELDYVKAARVSGASNLRIMFKHILPNTIQPIIISFTFNIGGVILSIAGLSYIGIGNPDTMIEWGLDIAAAENVFYYAPWALIWPGVMIVITVFGFMLLGDGLRDALDPRLKNL